MCHEQTKMTKIITIRNEDLEVAEGEVLPVQQGQLAVRKVHDLRKVQKVQKALNPKSRERNPVKRRRNRNAVNIRYFRIPQTPLFQI